MKKTNGFSLFQIIIIVCITSVISAITAGIIVLNNYDLTYKSLSEDSSLKEFLETYSDIVDNYYQDIDKDAMLDKAIDAMLDYLGDDYTTHLNDDESEALNEKLDGTYKGIGITYSNNTITAISFGGPADKAGLKIGDVFLKVNGTDITEENTNEIANLIKDSDEENISVIVKRGEEEISASVAIGEVPTPVVSYQMLDNNVGYLYIEVFSKTLKSQVSGAIEYLESLGMEKLIIDMRDNPGGYLESAEGVGNLFIENGKIIYSLENKNNKTEYKDETDESRNYPIAILMNGNTASAAEILAAALKDSYGAVLVGKTSYGKGKVQQKIEMSDGTITKVTSARWLRPSGACIDGVGLIPDYEVDNTTDESGNLIDNQINKAIEVISTM